MCIRDSLIFDEYVAFFEMLGTKESVGLLSQLKKIVMLGRQAGYFLIVACQRPDAKSVSYTHLDVYKRQAVSIEYVKQYTDSHSGISKNHACLLYTSFIYIPSLFYIGFT